MNIPFSTIEPFGVLGFPKPMPAIITNVADPMEAVRSLEIVSQSIMGECRKLTFRWGVENIEEDENGIYVVHSEDT